MAIVHFYCRGCRNYTPHSIVDTNNDNPKFDAAKIQCVHKDMQSFVVTQEKGKPVTEYSKRVEMANPEE